MLNVDPSDREQVKEEQCNYTSGVTVFCDPSNIEQVEEEKCKHTYTHAVSASLPPPLLVHTKSRKRCVLIDSPPSFYDFIFSKLQQVSSPTQIHAAEDYKCSLSIACKRKPDIAHTHVTMSGCNNGVGGFHKNLVTF